MAETLDEAREAVFQKVVDNWTSTPFVFQGENDSSLYGGSVAWARFSVVETGSEQETLGQKTDRRYRRENLLTAQIFTPANSGSRQSGTLAEAARDLFEGEEFSDLDFIDGVIIIDLGTDKEMKWQQTIVRGAFAYEKKK